MLNDTLGITLSLMSTPPTASDSRCAWDELAALTCVRVAHADAFHFDVCATQPSQSVGRDVVKIVKLAPGWGRKWTLDVEALGRFRWATAHDCAHVYVQPDLCLWADDGEPALVEVKLSKPQLKKLRPSLFAAYEGYLKTAPSTSFGVLFAQLQQTEARRKQNEAASELLALLRSADAPNPTPKLLWGFYDALRSETRAPPSGWLDSWSADGRWSSWSESPLDRTLTRSSSKQIADAIIDWADLTFPELPADPSNDPKFAQAFAVQFRVIVLSIARPVFKAKAEPRPLRLSTTHDDVHGFQLNTGTSPPARAPKPELAASRPILCDERDNVRPYFGFAADRDSRHPHLPGSAGRSLHPSLRRDAPAFGRARMERRLGEGRRPAGRPVRHPRSGKVGARVYVDRGPRCSRVGAPACVRRLHAN